MHLPRVPGRAAAVVAALALSLALAPAATLAQAPGLPQCSDGIDNDGDGAVDADDPGCVEAESPYAQPLVRTVALPLVALRGTVDADGTVNVARLSVRASRGSTVRVSCSGRHCPVRTSTTVMLTTSQRLRRLETALRPPMLLRLRIGIPGTLGKYVSYRVRRGKAPKRVDSCIDPDSRKVRGCFVG